MRLAIIGLGAVGEATAHAAVSSGLARVLVLMNRGQEVVQVAKRDLEQSRAWAAPLETLVGRHNSGRLLKGCDAAVLN